MHYSFQNKIRGVRSAFRTDPWGGAGITKFTKGPKITTLHPNGQT